jgi:PAS domain S-box-containing protein
MLIFLALYQDWTAYLLAVVFVLIHHGVFGVLWPGEVYNHPAALSAPWTWAAIHAFFILSAGAGSVTAWRFNEVAAAETKLILDSIGEGILGLDLEGKLTLINPAAQNMLGLNNGNSLGLPFHQIVSLKKFNKKVCSDTPFSIAESLQNGLAHHSADQVFCREDGICFPVEYQSTPVVQRGVFQGLVVNFTDITDRKLADERQHRDLEQLSILNEIGQAVNSTLDLKGVLNLLLNKIDETLPYSAVTLRLYNRQTGSLEPVDSRNMDEEQWKQNSGDFEYVGPQGLSRTVFERKAPLALRDIQSDPNALRPELFHRQGFVSFLGLPLMADGEVLGVLGVYTKKPHEFTREEIKFLTTLVNQVAVAIHNSQLYEQVRQQAIELDKANRLQADFTAMIVHDLRSPLMSIMSIAALLEDGLFGKMTAEQKKWVSKINVNSSELGNLVSDILDLSKLEAGRIEVVKQSIDLGDFMKTSLETFLPVAKEKQISLKIKPISGIDKIEADPRRLDQVLQNLVSNAMKFTPEGGKIEVGAKRIGSNEVRIWVKDSGIGIAPDEISSLFQKYHQMSNANSGGGKGTGLGLLICKMIVEAHGGSIQVESDLGKGSTFTVTIPLEPRELMIVEKDVARLDSETTPVDAAYC